MSSYSLVISSTLECTEELSLRIVLLIQFSYPFLEILTLKWTTSTCVHKLNAGHGSYTKKICSFARWHNNFCSGSYFGSTLLFSTVEVIICLIDPYKVFPPDFVSKNFCMYSALFTLFCFMLSTVGLTFFKEKIHDRDSFSLF